MASNDPEDPSSNTVETDEETIAIRKKRLRRVSFADREITSVHIFKRDEDYDTPPNSSASKLPSSVDADSVELENELPGFFRDLGDGDDSKELLFSPSEREEDDEVSRESSFLRPMETPSPGSSFVGSATSNDEDNFFGPVSSRFIRPGRLSDSGASDEHHDITMDSTAFSMHFRSLARSESGDLNTSSGFHLASEEETPSLANIPSDPGSSMVLTKAKRLFLMSPLPCHEVSGSKDEMSLVGETVHKYDYGRLSPTLEALLAEGSKDLHSVSASDAGSSKLSKSDGSLLYNGSSAINQHDSEGAKMHYIGHDMAAKEVPLDDANYELPIPVERTSHGCKLNEKDSPAADACAGHQFQTPNQSNKLEALEDSFKSVVPMSILNVDSAALNDTTKDIYNKTLPELFTPNKTGHQPSIVVMPKKDSPSERKQNSAINEITSQQYRSPLAGSISSLSAKRKQILLDIRPSIGFPDESQLLGFPLSNENTKQGKVLSSIQQYKAKFQNVESCASSLMDRIENSKVILSEYLSSATSSKKVMEKTSNNWQCKHVDAPIINLEEQVFNSDLKKAPGEDMINMSDGNGTLMIGTLSQDVEITSKRTPLVAAAASTSQFTSSGKEVPDLFAENLLTDEVISGFDFSPVHITFNRNSDKKVADLLAVENFAGVAGASSRSDSSRVGITFNHESDKKTLISAENLGSPSVSMSVQRLISSIDHSNMKSSYPQSNLVGISPRRESLSTENDFNGHDSTAKTGEFDAVHSESRPQSSSTPNQTNQLEDFSHVKKFDSRESDIQDLPIVSENFRSFQSPSRNGGSLGTLSEMPGKDHQKAIQKTWCSEDLPAQVICNVSPDARRNTNQLLLDKRLSKEETIQSPESVFPTQSPSGKELLKASSDGSNMELFVQKDAQPLNSNSNDASHQGVHILELHLTEQDAENSSRHKRKNQELDSGEADHPDKLNRGVKSPKVQKSGDYGLELASEPSTDSNNGNARTRGSTILMDWNDISKNISVKTNQLLSPLGDKLNIKTIVLLDDALDHLKHVHKCEILCSEIQSQKFTEQSSSIRQNKQAEIKSLLSKLAYEKAKLQLKHLNREKLLKRTEELSSGVLECALLRSNFTQNLTLYSDPDEQINFEEKHEVAPAKVRQRKHEFEASDLEIRNLTKSFHIYCKMEGEPSCEEIIPFLNDYLKKKMQCRFLRHDLQLWELDNLARGNGHHDLFLNYRGLINQRLTVNSALSSLSVLNNINDTSIMKNFPNMDACTAFAFVFDAKYTKKYIKSKSFAQETQTTSLVLRNLLDVVEEVQLARLEIRNLMQTCFISPSAEQLSLELSFINFSSGRKYMITLDMTCLNCGIYPSEVLPCQMQGPPIGIESSVSGEIKTALGNLRVGYSRIIRLCRSISQVLQSSLRRKLTQTETKEDTMDDM